MIQSFHFTGKVEKNPVNMNTLIEVRLLLTDYYDMYFKCWMEVDNESNFVGLKKFKDKKIEKINNELGVWQEDYLLTEKKKKRLFKELKSKQGIKQVVRNRSWDYPIQLSNTKVENNNIYYLNQNVECLRFQFKTTWNDYGFDAEFMKSDGEFYFGDIQFDPNDPMYPKGSNKASAIVSLYETQINIEKVKGSIEKKLRLFFL